MEFKHPFISSPRLTAYYFVIWAIIITGGILLEWLAYSEELRIALAEAVIFPMLFSILGLSIWYVIKAGSIESSKFLRVIFVHTIAATILNSIWLYVGFVIVKLFNMQANLWLEDNLALAFFIGYMLYLSYILFFYAVSYYHGFKEKLRNEKNLKLLVREAELHALKSQINPHFLFNSLNSISSLTMTNPGKAQEMVIILSSLMRYSLRHNQVDMVAFNEELENNKLYLQIEKVRFGKKLNALFEIEDNCYHAKVPSMILQPLYENAIKYGVYEATEPVTISTLGRCINNDLEITICNTYDPKIMPRKGEGIGLRNIRDRLQLIFGNPMLMKVENIENQFIVTIAIPQK